jgi:hypothetical protein
MSGILRTIINLVLVAYLAAVSGSGEHAAEVVMCFETASINMTAYSATDREFRPAV